VTVLHDFYGGGYQEQHHNIAYHGESEQSDMLWDLAPAARLSIQLLRLNDKHYVDCFLRRVNE
jgi:hypothetical protein